MVHETAPLTIYTVILFFNGIQESIHHKSFKVWHSKWKLLYFTIQFHINLTTKHYINKWSTVSCEPQKIQEVYPNHPLFKRFVFVRILFLLTNKRKIISFKRTMVFQTTSKSWWTIPPFSSHEYKEWIENFPDEDHLHRIVYFSWDLIEREAKHVCNLVHSFKKKIPINCLLKYRHKE